MGRVDSEHDSAKGVVEATCASRSDQRRKMESNGCNFEYKTVILSLNGI